MILHCMLLLPLTFKHAPARHPQIPGIEIQMKICYSIHMDLEALVYERIILPQH